MILLLTLPQILSYLLNNFYFNQKTHVFSLIKSFFIPAHFGQHYAKWLNFLNIFVTNKGLNTFCKKKPCQILFLFYQYPHFCFDQLFGKVKFTFFNRSITKPQGFYVRLLYQIQKKNKLIPLTSFLLSLQQLFPYSLSFCLSSLDIFSYLFLPYSFFERLLYPFCVCFCSFPLLFLFFQLLLYYLINDKFFLVLFTMRYFNYPFL